MAGGYNSLMPDKESLLKTVFRRPLLASLGISCLYFFLGWLFFTPFFQSNDDMVMNWITRGFWVVDHPSEFLVVVNVFLGILLKNLNLAWPHVPWFGLGLFGVFFLWFGPFWHPFSQKNDPPGPFCFIPPGNTAFLSLLCLASIHGLLFAGRSQACVLRYIFLKTYLL